MSSFHWTSTDVEESFPTGGDAIAVVVGCSFLLESFKAALTRSKVCVCFFSPYAKYLKNRQYLFAVNPDIRTLEKQIATLTRFALKRLELKNGGKKGEKQ